MPSVLDKLRSGLSKTRANLLESVGRVMREHQRIDEDLFGELEETLIAADVGVNATEKIVRRLRDAVLENEARNADIIQLLKAEMVSLLSRRQDASEGAHPKPEVILIVGVNGTGKTTSIGKLAYRFRQSGKKVLVATADTFRAAAGEQLEVWAQRAGADMVKTQHGADPASVAFDSLKAAIAREVDVLLVDTAGRLHTKVNLMEELRKIHRVLNKCLPGAPHEVLLVIDATTGQNAINQARQFRESVGISGIFLAKLDGTAKGGIVIAICEEFGIPVKYIGLGETNEDIAEFNPCEFVEALFQ